LSNSKGLLGYLRQATLKPPGAGGQVIIQRPCQPWGRHLLAISLLTRAPLRILPVATSTPIRCANLGASLGREMLYDNKPVDFPLQEGG
jgi:hypothetical protein